MGIDIRDGQQLECITCALCIDACDSVMEKTGRPLGLIAYATLDEYQSNMALATAGGTRDVDPLLVRTADGGFSDKIRHFDWKIIFRLRTMLYFCAWAAMGIGLIVALLNRDRLEVNVLHDRNPQYVLESSGSIRNGYTVRILNMIPEPRTIRLSIDGLPFADMKVNGMDKAGANTVEVSVEPDEATTLKVFVTLPGDQVAWQSENFYFLVEDVLGHETATYKAVFNGPGARP